MGSVKRMFFRLGLCTVFLISISLVYGVNGVSAKSLKHNEKHNWKDKQTTVIKLWSKGQPAIGIFGNLGSHLDGLLPKGVIRNLA